MLKCAGFTADHFHWNVCPVCSRGGFSVARATGELMVPKCESGSGRAVQLPRQGRVCGGGMKFVIAVGKYTDKNLPQPGDAIAQTHRMAGLEGTLKIT